MDDLFLYNHIKKAIKQRKTLQPSSTVQDEKSFAQKYCRRQLAKKKLNIMGNSTSNVANNSNKMKMLMKNFTHVDTYVDLNELLYEINLLRTKQLNQETQTRRMSKLNGEAIEALNNAKNKNYQKSGFHPQSHNNDPTVTPQSTNTIEILQQKVRNEVSQIVKQKYLQENSPIDRVVEQIQKNSPISNQLTKNHSNDYISCLSQQLERIDKDLDFDDGHEREKWKILKQVSEIKLSSMGKGGSGCGMQQNGSNDKYSGFAIRSTALNSKEKKEENQLLHKISTFLQIALQNEHKQKWATKQQRKFRSTHGSFRFKKGQDSSNFFMKNISSLNERETKTIDIGNSSTGLQTGADLNKSTNQSSDQTAPQTMLKKAKSVQYRTSVGFMNNRKKSPKNFDSKRKLMNLIKQSNNPSVKGQESNPNSEVKIITPVVTNKKIPETLISRNDSTRKTAPFIIGSGGGANFALEEFKQQDLNAGVNVDLNSSFKFLSQKGVKTSEIKKRGIYQEIVPLCKKTSQDQQENVGVKSSSPITVEIQKQTPNQKPSSENKFHVRQVCIKSINDRGGFTSQNDNQNNTNNSSFHNTKSTTFTDKKPTTQASPIFAKRSSHRRSFNQNGSNKIQQTFTFKNRHKKKQVLKKIEGFLQTINEEQKANKKENQYYDQVINYLQGMSKSSFQNYEPETLAGNEEISQLKEFVNKINPSKKR